MSSNLKVNTILPSVGSNIGLGTNGGNLNVDGGCKVQVGTALTLGHTVGVQFATQNLHSAGFEVNQINASGIITASSGVNISGGNLQMGGTNVLNSGRALYNLEQIKLGDSKELVLGSGNDLKIYHSGVHSFISEEGNGALKFKGDDIRFEDAGGTEALRITSTGNLQFNTTANGQSLILKSTGNYYNKLQFDSNASSAGGELAYIDFSWDGDKVADILAVAGSDTTNKDDGHLVFRTSPSQGAIAERLRINSYGQVGINTSIGGQLAIAMDSSNTNPLATGFIALSLKNVNATDNSSVCMDFNNSVGGIVGRIGAQFKDTSDKDTDLYFATRADGGSLSEKFRITSDGYLNFYNDSNTNKGLRWYNNVGGSAKAASIEWGNGNANWEFKHFRNDNQANNPYANIDFFTGDFSNPTRALRITNDGNHIREKHSRFSTRVAYTGGNESASTKIPFQSAHVNVGSDFSDSNDRYTAPVDGDYVFYFFTNVTSSSSRTFWAEFRINGSSVYTSKGGIIYDYFAGSGWVNLSGHIMFRLDEGDYVEVWNGSSVVNYDGNNYGQWMGWLLG